MKTTHWILAFALFSACDISFHLDQPETVRSDQVVLLRSGPSVAAFVLTKQSKGRPDVAEYSWVFREEGTLLDPEDGSVKSGKSKTSDSIVEIGNMKVAWSYGAPLSGYLYHSAEDGDDLEICVTELGLEDLPVDTTDPKFVWH